MKTIVIALGVAVLSLLAGAAVAGRPTRAPDDVTIAEIPAAALSTTTTVVADSP